MPTPVRIPKKDLERQSPSTISKLIKDAYNNNNNNNNKDDSKEAQWQKYYKKLYKYKDNLEQGFSRHPRLKKFVDGERKRYDFYAKHRPDRIDKLQQIPGIFAWGENGECFNNVKVETTTTTTTTTTTPLPTNEIFVTNDVEQQQAQIEAENNDENVMVPVKQEDDSAAYETTTQFKASAMMDDSGSEAEDTISYKIDIKEAITDSAHDQSQQLDIQTDYLSMDIKENNSDLDDDQSTETEDNPLVLLNNLHKRSDTQVDSDDDDNQSTKEEDDTLDSLKNLQRESDDRSLGVSDDSDYDTAKDLNIVSEKSQQLEKEIEDQSVNLTNNLDIDDQSTEVDNDEKPFISFNDLHERSDDKPCETLDCNAAEGTTIASEQTPPAFNNKQSQQSELRMEDKSNDIKSTMEDPARDKTKGSSISSEQAISTSVNSSSHQKKEDTNHKSNQINTHLDRDDPSMETNDNTTLISSKDRDNSDDDSVGGKDSQTVLNQSTLFPSEQSRSKKKVKTSSNESNRQRYPKRSAPQVASKNKNKKSNKAVTDTMKMSISAIAKNTRSRAKKVLGEADHTTNSSYRKPVTRSSRSNAVINSSQSDEKLAAKPEHRRNLRRKHDSFSKEATKRKRSRNISQEDDHGGNKKKDKKSEKAPKNVVNELQSLQNYFQANLCNHQKDKSFYYGILQKDKSHYATSIKKLCKKRRYDLNTGVSKGIFSTQLALLLKKKLAELNDDLVDLLDPKDSEEYRDLSLDEKVSNLIGNHGVTTNLDMFFENMNDNISDLRKYYTSNVSNSKNNKTWYQSTLMYDVSEKGIQLRAFCRDRRRYFNNVFSGKKHSDQYFQKVVKIFVSLYDDLEKSVGESKISRDKSKQLQDFDKVKCLIGSDEDGKVSISWVKASDDIRNLENYYVENIISKDKSNTWYNSILMSDSSDGANILKDWCRGKRYTIFSDSTHKLKEGPYTDMLRKGLVELYDRLEKRSSTDSEQADLKSDAEKVSSLVGAFRLEKGNFRCAEYGKFIEQLKQFYEKHKELKNNQNTWFYGVFLSKEVSEPVRAPLKFWCLRQRAFFTKYFEREDDTQSNAELKWKLQLFADLYDDLERIAFPKTLRKRVKKSLGEKLKDLVGDPECSFQAPFSNRIKNECEQLRRYYFDNVWRRENDDSPFFQLLKEDRSHQAVALKQLCKQRREYFKRVIFEDRCDDRLYSVALKFYEDLYDELGKGRRSRKRKKTRIRTNPHEKLFSILGSGKS